MYYITGDLHRDLDRVRAFCDKTCTTREDILIVVGDAGFNYYLDERDLRLKQEAQEFNITLFMIHGNHEERPFLIESYKEKEFHGGTVYYEEAFPNLLFAKDGEVYIFNEQKYLVIGGGYSIDKWIRLSRRAPYFESELPSDKEKQRILKRIGCNDWQVHGVLTHVAPLSKEPTWAFLPGVDQRLVDKSLEQFLERVEHKLKYDVWYIGHYHIDFEKDVKYMFKSIEALK